MHVDDFIDDCSTDVYASWVLNMFRMSAASNIKYSKIIGQYALYCTYEEKKYRVTGASRLGDIWLVADFDKTSGYDLRVDIEKCTQFTNGAETP